MEIVVEDRVVILPDPKQDTTAAGLLIDGDTLPPPPTGTIVAVGSGKKDVKMVLKVGDKVLYSTQELYPFVIGPTQYFITFQRNVHLVLERPNDSKAKGNSAA